MLTITTVERPSMKKSILSLAMLVGMSGATNAGETKEVSDDMPPHKIEISEAPRTGAVDEIVNGSYKGINIEVVSHRLHEYNFASAEDSVKFEDYVGQVARRHGWPQEVARDISSRAMVYTVVKENTSMADVFAKTDKEFETRLGEDLQYIEDNGAEAYLQNRLGKDVSGGGRSVSFDEVRRNLSPMHETPSGIKYRIDGSKIAFEGSVSGLQASKLMPRYAGADSDKQDAHGLFPTYRRPDGKYQCGGSIGMTSNLAQSKERHALQMLCVQDDICKDMQRRQNGGEELSATETNFMRNHGQLLKKHGLCHDGQGGLVRMQQNNMKQKSRSR